MLILQNAFKEDDKDEKYSERNLIAKYTCAQWTSNNKLN